MRNLLRNLTVFAVDVISYPLGKAIDRIDFSNLESERDSDIKPFDSTGVAAQTEDDE